MFRFLLRFALVATLALCAGCNGCRAEKRERSRLLGATEGARTTGLAYPERDGKHELPEPHVVGLAVTQLLPLQHDPAPQRQRLG